jgi:trk system potassium uptake protein
MTTLALNVREAFIANTLRQISTLKFRMPGIRTLRIPIIKIPKPSSPFSSPLLLIYSFAALIILGAIFLMLPVSSKTGNFTPPIDAFFSAASAACVTGLTVVDTGTYWSSFGQVVLLILFQIGGLGFITAATMLFIGINRKFGLRERLAISETIGIDRLGGALGIVVKLAIFSLVIEVLGTVIFYFRFSSAGVGAPLWTAVFHAVSAFNNCGMDLLGNFKSLVGCQDDAIILLVTAILIIIGGIGYLVIADIIGKRSFNRLTLDSKIVLVTTLSLLIIGTAFILSFEYSNPTTFGQLSFPEKILVAFFQAVSPRTAGFTAVDIGSLKQVTLFFVMFLMFIGGAAGSTAGGVKVNTLGILVLTVRSLFRGSNDVDAFNRRLVSSTVYRAITLFLLYLVILAVIVLILSITEKFPLDKLLFESFSALSTVGLSTGITPLLSGPGKIVILLAMFCGRLGPLTLIVYLAHRHQRADIGYPQENIRLG